MKPSRFTDLVDTINSAPIGPEQKTAAPNASAWANCGAHQPRSDHLATTGCSDARALASAGSQAERRRGPEFIIPPTKVGFCLLGIVRHELEFRSPAPFSVSASVPPRLLVASATLAHWQSELHARRTT